MKLCTVMYLGLTCLALSKPTAANETPQSIAGLIIQLSSDAYKARENASHKLWELGEASLPQLKSVANSDDPEQGKRAQILIRNIEAGVLPSTDKKVIGAIDRYRSSASMTEKLQALEALVDLNALRQVLFLLHWEENPRAREELGKSRRIRGVASFAAKQAIAGGKIEEAIQLLRIAPKNETNYRALAHILKYSDRLDTEIELTEEKLPAKDAQSWLLTQLRIKGDLKNAKHLAKKTKNEQAIATFTVLEGNPAPLLDFCISRSSTPHHTIVLNLLKRLHQQNNPSDIHEAIAQLAEGINGDGDGDGDGNLEYVTRISLLMGDRAIGEKLLKHYNETYARSYFSSQEYSDEEFELLGTPNPVTQPQKFELWLQAEIKRELDDDLALLEEQSSKVEELVRFYYNRGEREQSLRILKPLLDALLDDGDDRWFKIVGELPIYGMGELVAQLAGERGNEDNTYLQLSHEIFGNVEEMDCIWNQVEELSVGATDLERFQSVLELMGVDHGLTSEKKSILNQIEDRLELAKGRARVDLLVALAFAAERRNDFEAMLDYYKELCEDRGLLEEREFHLKYQLAAEVVFDWEELVKSYDLRPASYLKSPTRLARYAIAKRNLGEKEFADTLLNQAILLTLGQTKELNEFAAVLHECGARNDAKTIWLEHIACLDVGSWGFYYTLNYINHQSRFAINEADWKLASSLSLAELTFLLEPSLRPSHYYTTLRSGYTAIYTAGMALLERGDKSGALDMLEYAHGILPGDGTLADDFFPGLVGTPLKKEVSKWFNESWNHIEKEIAAYPNDHNARNTVAWLGSRAGMRLDDSLKHAKFALRFQPQQPAYLDTLAEVYFAKRDRANAIKFSDISLSHIKTGAHAYTRNADSSASMYSELTQQNIRFKNEDFSSR